MALGSLGGFVDTALHKPLTKYFSQTGSLKIRGLANLMKFRNVDRSILRLRNCEMFGRATTILIKGWHVLEMKNYRLL